MGVPHGTPGEGVSAAIAHSLVFKVPPNHALQADWNPAQFLASLAMPSRLYLEHTLVLGSSGWALLMGAISGAVFAQSGANLPLQRGVSVQLAVTTNAVAVPNADRQDALVVALTADGTTYLHADRVPMPDLANRVRSTLSTQKDKTLYIKADARVPYARLVEVMDAVQKSGVQGLTFLTAQQDAADQGKRPVSPKGLELRVR